VGVTYVEPRPGSVLRNWQVTGTARNEMNYAGQTILRQVGGTMQGLHLSYWNAFLSGNWQFTSFDDRLTRGGPLAERPRMMRLGTGFGTDPRRPLGVGVQLQFNRDAAGGGSDVFTVISLYKPTPKWDLGVVPQLMRSRSGAQFVGSIADARATGTFGRRYLFTPLDQTTFALETRVNYTVNPRLSLQFYAQPYISSADFGAPGELRAPGTYDFLVYGSDIGEVQQIPGGWAIDPAGIGQGGSFGLPNRDFNLRSLRGNAVLRWEWRAGSTLYLAWQQSREDFAALTGNFDFSRDRAALLRAPADNVFVVKLNYWWNP
jgi:hypothetical protein